MGWFLYDNGLRHERVKFEIFNGIKFEISQKFTQYIVSLKPELKLTKFLLR